MQWIILHALRIVIASVVSGDHHRDHYNLDLVLSSRYPLPGRLADIVPPRLVTRWDDDIRTLNNTIDDVRRIHGEKLARLATSVNGRSLLLSGLYESGSDPALGIVLIPDWQEPGRSHYYEGVMHADFLCNRFVQIYNSDLDRRLVDLERLDHASISLPPGNFTIADNARWARLTPDGTIVVGSLDGANLGTARVLQLDTPAVACLWLHGGRVLVIGLRDHTVLTVTSPDFTIVQHEPGELSDQRLQSNMFILKANQPVAHEEHPTFDTSVAIVRANGRFNTHPLETVVPIGCYRVAPSGMFALCISDGARSVQRMPGCPKHLPLPTLPEDGAVLGWLAARAEGSWQIE